MNAPARLVSHLFLARWLCVVLLHGLAVQTALAWHYVELAQGHSKCTDAPNQILLTLTLNGTTVASNWMSKGGGVRLGGCVSYSIAWDAIPHNHTTVTIGGTVVFDQDHATRSYEDLLIAADAAPANTNCWDSFTITVTNTLPASGIVGFNAITDAGAVSRVDDDSGFPRLFRLPPGIAGTFTLSFACDEDITQIDWYLSDGTWQNRLEGAVDGTEAWLTNVVMDPSAAYAGTGSKLADFSAFTNRLDRADKNLPTDATADLGDVVKAVGNLDENRGKDGEGLLAGIRDAINSATSEINKEQDATQAQIALNTASAATNSYLSDARVTNALAILSGTMTNELGKLNSSLTNGMSLLDSTLTNLLDKATNMSKFAELPGQLSSTMTEIAGAYGDTAMAAIEGFGEDMSAGLANFGRAGQGRASPLRIARINGAIGLHATAGETIYDGALFYPFASWIRSIIIVLLLVGYGKLMLWQVTNDVQGLATVPIASTSLLGASAAPFRLAIALLVIGMIMPTAASICAINGGSNGATIAELIDFFLGIPSSDYAPSGPGAGAIFGAATNLALHLLSATMPLEVIATMAVNHGMYVVFRSTIITGAYYGLRILGL